jgi:hypothetical protein
MPAVDRRPVDQPGTLRQRRGRARLRSREKVPPGQADAAPSPPPPPEHGIDSNCAASTQAPPRTGLIKPTRVGPSRFRQSRGLSSFGEKPPSGEPKRRSFRLRSIKAGAQRRPLRNGLCVV